MTLKSSGADRNPKTLSPQMNTDKRRWGKLDRVIARDRMIR